MHKDIVNNPIIGEIHKNGKYIQFDRILKSALVSNAFHGKTPLLEDQVQQRHSNNL